MTQEHYNELKARGFARVPISPEVSRAASELGKRAKGIRKNLTETERARRREFMNQLNAQTRKRAGKDESK